MPDFLFMGEQPEHFGRERIYDGTPTASERFEMLAAEFRRDTGMTAPGKDEAPAAGGHDIAAREDAWAQWLKNKADVAEAKARGSK
jgi:hypothetical protein